jgi:hypothetical protein
MIVLGLLVLLAAGGLAVSGITTRDDAAHARAHFPARSGLPGYHLPGPGSRLFFFGLVLAAAATSGLASVVAGLARGVRPPQASRQLPQAPTGALPAAGAVAGRDNTDRGH